MQIIFKAITGSSSHTPSWCDTKQVREKSTTKTGELVAALGSSLAKRHMAPLQAPVVPILGLIFLRLPDQRQTTISTEHSTVLTHQQV